MSKPRNPTVVLDLKYMSASVERMVVVMFNFQFRNQLAVCLVLVATHLGCSFPVKCRFVYAAWLALLRLPYQRCWQKLRKQTDISQESYSPGSVALLDPLIKLPFIIPTTASKKASCKLLPFKQWNAKSEYLSTKDIAYLKRQYPSC